MLGMYFEAYRDWGFASYKEYKMLDRDLVKIAKEVRKMLEEGKKVEEVEKILYEEYYGFEEGDYSFEKEDKAIILSNRIGEAVKIVLIDFEKELEKIEKELKEWLYQKPPRQIYEVYYNNWREGGFSGIIEEVALGEVEELTVDDVKIETAMDGVKAIFEEWSTYILDSEDWKSGDRFYYEKTEDSFKLILELSDLWTEEIEIKVKEG
jgi:hypothetical protein